MTLLELIQALWGQGLLPGLGEDGTAVPASCQPPVSPVGSPAVLTAWARSPGSALSPTSTADIS